MSSVRMCDNCGSIFSESEDGWQTGTVSTVGQDDFGRSMTRMVQQDRCPDCAVGTKGKPKVRPRIGQPTEAQMRQLVNASTGETPSETADRVAAAKALGQIVQENKLPA